MSVRLQFEGVRCFSKRQEAVIRPITLLVGENSSGKSTFLALCKVARWIVRGFPGEIPFNEPPFLLGAYDQIASYQRGSESQAKSFSVGLAGDDYGSIEATFVEKGSQPTMRTWCLTSGRLKLSALVGRSGTATFSLTGTRMPVHLPKAKYFRVPRLLSWLWQFDAESKRPNITDSELMALQKALDSIETAFGRRSYAFAPIRTSPQRTYDPVSAEPKPEGSHVPMLLAELSHSRAKRSWTRLQAGLNKFGAESGLFDQISVIRKGRKESDPFQIGVRSGGPAFNLVDVGYGVSQVLPILVDTLLHSGARDMFLMQQPEVHLHPKAQAELGSFFARQATSNRRFVIETHSDYLVDRVRMEVRRGKYLRPQDVSLLYFERGKNGAVIHNLELEKDGSIIDAPKGYRRFFLDEEYRLLDI
jgi:hypothetical protein